MIEFNELMECYVPTIVLNVDAKFHMQWFCLVDTTKNEKEARHLKSHVLLWKYDDDYHGTLKYALAMEHISQRLPLTFMRCTADLSSSSVKFLKRIFNLEPWQNVQYMFVHPQHLILHPTCYVGTVVPCVQIQRLVSIRTILIAATTKHAFRFFLRSWLFLRTKNPVHVGQRKN